MKKYPNVTRLFGVEMLENGEWVFLPNIIMVSQRDADFEMAQLVAEGHTCRLVGFERNRNVLILAEGYAEGFRQIFTKETK